MLCSSFSGQMKLLEPQVSLFCKWSPSNRCNNTAPVGTRTPPWSVPSPGAKGGWLCVRLAPAPRKNTLRCRNQYQRTKDKWCKERSYPESWDHEGCQPTPVGSWHPYLSSRNVSASTAGDGELEHRTSLREWGTLDRLGKENLVHGTYHSLFLSIRSPAQRRSCRNYD